MTGARLRAPRAAWGLRQVLRRLALASALLVPLAMFFDATLVEFCLPAYRVVFETVADEFRIVGLDLDREGADRVVRVRVALEPVLVLGGKITYPDPRGTANASTLVAHAVQGPVLAMLVALAWPSRR